MDIDHIHFYVDDADVWGNWFVQKLNLQLLGTHQTSDTYTVVVGNSIIYLVLSSPLTASSSVAHYLKKHPPGVADLAFQVPSVESTLQRAIASQAQLIYPLQGRSQSDAAVRWAQIRGWKDLTHTLIEGFPQAQRHFLPVCFEGKGVLIHLVPATVATKSQFFSVCNSPFVGIDHAVLNVAAGDLEQAVLWYETVLGFQRQQSFAIRTEYSALSSQVLIHPQGNAQLPINEPASPGSQIQEFLDANHGAGIQHVALKTIGLLTAISRLRQQGLSFLHVPAAYYDQLKHRPGFQMADLQWKAIARQEILVDWQLDTPDACLLQTFTYPIFKQPTFFLELIERQMYYSNQQYRQVEGFGEGNFRALFEAIEREQVKRGSLRFHPASQRFQNDGMERGE